MHLIGAGGHGRAAIEDVDIILVRKAFIFQHPHCRAAADIGAAEHMPRAVGEHRDIDRVLGHQISNELVAVQRIERVRLVEAHAEKAPGDAVPEGRVAGIVDDPAQLGQNAVGKARAVQADEQIAAAREQHAEAPGTLVRVEEQPADLARTFQIGDQAQDLGAEGAAQLGAVLGQRAEAIAIERPFLPDLGEQLAGPANLAGFGVLEHQHEQLVAQIVVRARETGRRAFDLALE